jgi:hypothetical protein
MRHHDGLTPRPGDITTIDVRRLAFRAAIAAVTAAVLVEATVVALLLESFRRYGLFETPRGGGGDLETVTSWARADERASCPARGGAERG